jgi:hypothetical protein
MDSAQGCDPSTSALTLSRHAAKLPQGGFATA